MAKGKVMIEIFKKATVEERRQQAIKKELEQIPVRLAHSRQEAAILMGISVRTLDYLIANGEISSRENRKSSTRVENRNRIISS